MVGRGALDPVVEVRVLLSQPLLLSHPAAPSSRGLGHGPLKAETRVRIPLGPPPFGSTTPRSIRPMEHSAVNSHHRPPGRCVGAYTTRLTSSSRRIARPSVVCRVSNPR